MMSLRMIDFLLTFLSCYKNTNLQLPPVRKGSEVHSSPMEICNMLALALLALMHLRSYLNILMNVILKNNSPYL